MAIILMIILMLLFIFSYKKSKKVICAPEVLFTFPFMVMSVVGAINYKEWALQNFKIITFMIIFLGVTFFILGSLSQSKTYVKREKNCEYKAPDINNNITIWHLLLSLVVELLAFILYAFFLVRWGMSNGVLGLSESINVAMMNGKFALGSTFNLPFVVNSMVICSRALGYTYSTVLAKNIIYKRKGHNILLAFNTFVPILISLLGGSRGTALEPIVGFGTAFLFYYYKKGNWRKKLKPKYVLIGSIALCALLLGFFSIKEVLGRASADWADFTGELFRYIGAQEKNLDALFETDVTHTKIFAYSTLESFYNIFNVYLGFRIKDDIVMLPFVVINGYNFGNVYTCFYNYYLDFGIIGVVVFSFVSGWVSKYVFRKAIYASSKQVDTWLIIYVYIASCLVFCFFGSRFYTNLLSASFIRFLVWMLFVEYFLTKVSFKRK